MLPAGGLRFDPGWEDPQQKEMATPLSSCLEIPEYRQRSHKTTVHGVKLGPQLKAS